MYAVIVGWLIFWVGSEWRLYENFVLIGVELFDWWGVVGLVCMWVEIGY